MTKAILRSEQEIDPGFDGRDGLGIVPSNGLKKAHRPIRLTQDLDHPLFTALLAPDDRAVRKDRSFPSLHVTVSYEGIVMLGRHFYQHLHLPTLVAQSIRGSPKTRLMPRSPPPAPSVGTAQQGKTGGRFVSGLRSITVAK